MREPEEQRGSIVGRGAAGNPKNRFERIEVEPAPDESDEEPGLGTLYLRDASRSIIARNNSPDIGFDASINPYRGCSHGCIYCFARPTHEYLGFSAGLDFESKVLVKEDAPELLRRELSSPRWRPQVIAMSVATDCYQPVEKKLRVTRRCLEVLTEFRNPVAVVTKNHLVTRDIDLLSGLARLPYAVRPLFEDWLERHFPERKEKVLNRIRSMRGGKLNDPRFGSRMRGEGTFARHIAQLFDISCRRAGIERGRSPKLSTAAFRNVGPQPSLFD